VGKRVDGLGKQVIKVNVDLIGKVPSWGIAETEELEDIEMTDYDKVKEVEARNDRLVLSGSSEGVFRARFVAISFRPEITQQTATCYLSSSEQIQYHDAQLFRALGLHANHLYTISRNT
jgi:hypothetical protein